jgi:hypothetical protein
MVCTEISNIRLVSQHVAAKKFTSVKDVVGYMGAMQAQDYAMAKWAVGSRLANATDKAVEDAINKGEIIRTHLMRPTWHIVSADDIYWLLDLTGIHVKSLLKTRHTELELAGSELPSIYSLLEKTLSGKCLTKDELTAEFVKAKISVDDNRLYHTLLRAELDGIVCSGVVKNKKQTYALLEERVPRPAPISRDEALGRLAQKYFTAHGPATLQDFVWWSGLPVRDARKAIDIIKSDFVSETIGSDVYWFLESNTKSVQPSDRVFLLSAFDEFLISYRDRKASISADIQPKAISSNGIFRPIIVVNGQVVGLWKRTIKKDTVCVEFQFLKTVESQFMDLIEQEVVRFGAFLGKNIEIKK